MSRREPLGWVLVVACSSSPEHSAGSIETGGGSGGNGGETQTSCPPGTGAWATQDPAPLRTGMDQYAHCAALCQAARDASCAGHDDALCVDYCVALENFSVNGRCTEAVGALIACFEAVDQACNTPQRSVAGTCQSQRDDMRCCFDRYCTDPTNAGRCG